MMQTSLIDLSEYICLRFGFISGKTHHDLGNPYKRKHLCWGGSQFHRWSPLSSWWGEWQIQCWRRRWMFFTLNQMQPEGDYPLHAARQSLSMGDSRGHVHGDTPPSVRTHLLIVPVPMTKYSIHESVGKNCIQVTITYNLNFLSSKISNNIDSICKA